MVKPIYNVNISKLFFKEMSNFTEIDIDLEFNGYCSL